MPVLSPRFALRSPSLADAADASIFGSNLNADLETLLGRMWSMHLREGALVHHELPMKGSLQVTQRAAGGANMSVDVAAGAAVVKEAGLGFASLTPVFHTALQNLVAPAAHGTNPRLDQVIENADGVTFYVPGTATAGATLTNRNGAVADATLDATYTTGWVRLADVLVPAAATTIVNANIFDRRVFADTPSMFSSGARDGAQQTFTAGTKTRVDFDVDYMAGGGPPGNFRWSAANPSRIPLFDAVTIFLLDFQFVPPAAVDQGVDVEVRLNAAGSGAGGTLLHTVSEYSGSSASASNNFHIVTTINQWDPVKHPAYIEIFCTKRGTSAVAYTSYDLTRLGHQI